MDTLTFIANLVKALALPVASIVALLIVLRHLPLMMKFIKSVKYKDLEINLRDEFLDAQRTATEILIARKPADTVGTHDEQLGLVSDKIRRLAEIDPGVAIAEIWKKVEAKTIQLIQHNGLMRFTRPEKFVEWLADNNRISRNEEALFSKLRRIRNSAVHDIATSSTISLAEVVDFDQFSDLFIERLEALRHEPGYLNYPIPETAK
jgi:hypothetical protein